MTEETRSRLDKLHYDISDILFDLVDENETLEGQVNELKEQVARLTEKGSAEGDLISRQAVIESIEYFQMNPRHFDFVNLIDDIKEIPSAENEGDLISRKSLLNKINAYVVGSQDKEFICKLIKEMPSAENEGEWIDDHADTVCSVCGWSCNEAYFWNDEKRTYGYYSKFCPNCGADMRGK